jgi:hypothetical protein
VDPKHAYSHRQGESVTRSDRRQREFKLGNPSPPLACLRESNGVVTRKGLAEQGGRYQSEKPFFNLGTVNPSLPFEMSYFANYRICPALLAPRQFQSFAVVSWFEFQTCKRSACCPNSQHVRTVQPLRIGDNPRSVPN